MDGHGAINDTARALFAPLGGDYDRWAAILSFAQDPRWRRFLVEHVPVGAGRARARRRHGHGRDRARARAALRLPRRRRRPVAADARRRARAHREAGSPTASSCGSAAPRSSTSPRAPSTRSRPATSCATSTIRSRPCAICCASCARAPRSRCSTSPCRRTSPRAASGTSTPASGCPCSGAWSRRDGPMSAATCARASPPSTRPTRRGLRELLTEAGGANVHTRLHESRRRTRRVGSRALSGDAQRVAFYALRPGGVRDCITLLHPPYTAWHLSYVALGAGLAEHVDGARLAWTLVASRSPSASPRTAWTSSTAGRSAPASPLARSPSPRPSRSPAPRRSGSGAWARSASPCCRSCSSASPSCSPTTSSCSAARCTPTTSSRSAGEPSRCSSAGSRRRGRSSCPSCSAPAFAAATSLAQRHLSNWARRLRRGGLRVEGFVERAGEERQVLDVATLTTPAEAALRALAAAHVLLAVALVALRLT